MDLVFTFSLFCKILKMSSPVFCQQRKIENDFFYEQSAHKWYQHVSPSASHTAHFSVCSCSPLSDPNAQQRTGFGGKRSSQGASWAITQKTGTGEAWVRDKLLESYGAKRTTVKMAMWTGSTNPSLLVACYVGFHHGNVDVSEYKRILFIHVL